MDRITFAASVFAAAVGLTGAAVTAAPASAQMMAKEQMMQVQQTNMARAKTGHLVSCYGINAVAKNDCAGQATSANDTKSFVLLPAGDCEMIHDGALEAS